jgi:hypothetical protein
MHIAPCTAPSLSNSKQQCTPQQAFVLRQTTACTRKLQHTCTRTSAHVHLCIMMNIMSQLAQVLLMIDCYTTTTKACRSGTELKIAVIPESLDMGTAVTWGLPPLSAPEALPMQTGVIHNAECIRNGVTTRQTAVRNTPHQGTSQVLH